MFKKCVFINFCSMLNPKMILVFALQTSRFGYLDFGILLKMGYHQNLENRTFWGKVVTKFGLSSRNYTENCIQLKNQDNLNFRLNSRGKIKLLFFILYFINCKVPFAGKIRSTFFTHCKRPPLQCVKKVDLIFKANGTLQLSKV